MLDKPRMLSLFPNSFLLNELGKRVKMRSLSIKPEHSCKILYVMINLKKKYSDCDLKFICVLKLV